ncbi:MAG: virulence protein [Desulfitobacterium hafniense]|nr:virulence protein [Desulfitobacterium hafniense]
MEIRFNVTGARRKELVQVVSEIADSLVNYKGAPTFAYEISGFTVDKEGTLSFDNMTDSELVERLLDRLADLGFECETADNLTIEMPLKGFTDAKLENLDRLIASKATLIKKAIGADELPVERTETTLKFPWFRFDTDGEAVAAYSRFIGALCAAAKEQKRMTAKEKPVENEKFAFRVFLIRLGFVGDEYKAARKILLKNLSGNSAFKNGAPAKAEVTADE